jgi:hypothetical protein
MNGMIDISLMELLFSGKKLKKGQELPPPRCAHCVDSTIRQEKGSAKTYRGYDLWICNSCGQIVRMIHNPKYIFKVFCEKCGDEKEELKVETIKITRRDRVVFRCPVCKTLQTSERKEAEREG